MYGLLKSAHTDLSNGYLYYSASQVSELNHIIALKSLGLTLEQIAGLAQQVHDELTKIDTIESRLKQIESDDNLVHDVVVYFIPAFYYIGSVWQCFVWLWQ